MSRPRNLKRQERLTGYHLSLFNDDYGRYAGSFFRLGLQVSKEAVNVWLQLMRIVCFGGA